MLLSRPASAAGSPRAQSPPGARTAGENPPDDRIDQLRALMQMPGRRVVEQYQVESRQTDMIAGVPDISADTVTHAPSESMKQLLALMQLSSKRAVGQEIQIATQETDMDVDLSDTVISMTPASGFPLTYTATVGEMMRDPKYKGSLMRIFETLHPRDYTDTQFPPLPRTTGSPMAVSPTGSPRAAGMASFSAALRAPSPILNRIGSPRPGSPTLGAIRTSIPTLVTRPASPNAVAQAAVMRPIAEILRAAPRGIQRTVVANLPEPMSSQTMGQFHAMQLKLNDLENTVGRQVIQTELDAVKLKLAVAEAKTFALHNESLTHQLNSSQGELVKLRKVPTAPNYLPCTGGSGPSSPKGKVVKRPQHDNYPGSPRRQEENVPYLPTNESLCGEVLTTVDGQRLPPGDSARIVKIATAQRLDLLHAQGAQAVSGFTLKNFCDLVINNEHEEVLAAARLKADLLAKLTADKEEKQAQIQHAINQTAAKNAASAQRYASELARLAVQSTRREAAALFLQQQEAYQRTMAETGGPEIPPSGEVSQHEIKISPTATDCATSKIPVKSMINLVTQSVTQTPDVPSAQTRHLSTKALLGFAKPATPETFRGLATDRINVWLKEVDNYLTQCGTHDSAWVGIAQSFLKGQALTVWTDTSSHFTEPPSWLIFRQSMMEQYGSYDVDRSARKAIKLVKQGNTSASDYVKAFRSVLSDIKGMDERTVIEQFIEGLNPDLQLQCSYDHSTQRAWTSLKDLARIVSIVDNERGALKSNTTLKVFSTAVQPPSQVQHQRHQSTSAGPNGRRQAFPGGTQGPPTDSTFRIQGPKQPNSAAVIADFKRRGKTQDVNAWKRVLAEWLKHTKSHGVCNRCARKHVVGECQVVSKSDWVIPPLLEKPTLGSTGI